MHNTKVLYCALYRYVEQTLFSVCYPEFCKFLGCNGTFYLLINLSKGKVLHTPRRKCRN